MRRTHVDAGRFRRAAATLAVVLALAGCWDAAGAAEAELPRDVLDELGAAARTCIASGATTFAIEPMAVIRRDLNGDGRDDYIIDLHQATCEPGPGLSTTAGSILIILVARPRGHFVRVFRGPVRGYEIEDGNGPLTIRFQLHGAYCGKVGNDRCVKVRHITETPFRFVD
ncbi:MAG TPA: hypothetical protein VIY51_14490 [Xanthobacteraceae bacterium]